MPSPVVRIALSQHNWDKFDLLDKFYDNQEKFFEKINVSNPFQEVATTSTVTTSTNGMWQCLTCYEELPSSVSWLFLHKYNIYLIIFKILNTVYCLRVSAIITRNHAHSTDFVYYVAEAVLLLRKNGYYNLL